MLHQCFSFLLFTYHCYVHYMERLVKLHLMQELFFVISSRYELMSSCWQLNSKDRPLFETLYRELEKILKNLPPAKDPEEILYVNMEKPYSSSFTEDGELGAVGGLDAKDFGDDIFSKPSAVTAEIHQPENTNRYVMCPGHEATRLVTTMDHPRYSSTVEEGTLEELLAGHGFR